MNEASLEQQLAEAQAMIRALQEELSESNRGILALNIELDERVEQRTAELAKANDALRLEIAERRHAEQERERVLAVWKRQNEFLRSLIDNASMGVAVVDRNLRYVLANPAYQSIPGAGQPGMVGRTIAEVFAPEVARIVEPFVRQVFDTGQLLRIPEYKAPIRGGTWWNVSEIPIRDAAGSVEAVMILTEDVTERKLSREALQQRSDELEAARVQAEQANHAKDQFLAVLSHELRTPLTPVLAAVQLMERMPALAPPLKKPLEVIRRNLQLEARLIDDLLDITRIARGKLILDRKPVSIAAVIERAVEIARPDIEARRLHFGVELKDGDVVVNADPSRLQQIIWNLLNNAVKFTPEGGCIGIRCARQQDRLVLEVKDSGIGMDAEVVRRVFDAFEQGGGAITRQFGGLGLGLAIVKRLVEMHEGKVTAESEGIGRGSTLRVSLPIAAQALSADAPKTAQPPPSQSRRILLVEDNGDTAAMIKLLLEASGYELETAADAAQALKAVELGRFDLMISDLGLPDLSGIDLLQQLRQRGQTLKAVALSGYGREEDVQRCIEAGFSAHLVKPVEAEILLDAVSQALGP